MEKGICHSRTGCRGSVRLRAELCKARLHPVREILSEFCKGGYYMYAIVLTGGKQYKVKEGEIIKVELLKAREGDEVGLEVLFISDGEKMLAGKDAVSAKVLAEVIGEGKGKKINIFTYKAKKNVRRRKGHRQPYTQLRIKSIAF